MNEKSEFPKVFCSARSSVFPHQSTKNTQVMYKVHIKYVKYSQIRDIESYGKTHRKDYTK